MKKIQVETTVYECGDLLDISSVMASHHKPGLDRAKKGLVVGVHSGTKGYSYRVITDEGIMFTVKSYETGNERYIGHIDLSTLFGEAVM